MGWNMLYVNRLCRLDGTILSDSRETGSKISLSRLHNSRPSL